MTLTPQAPVAVPVHSDGRTCSACVHFKRCSWLLSYDGTETSCDWTPSRFVDASASRHSKGGEK